jgi:hypothetical protein
MSQFRTAHLGSVKTFFEYGVRDTVGQCIRASTGAGTVLETTSSGKSKRSAYAPVRREREISLVRFLLEAEVPLL